MEMTIEQKRAIALARARARAAEEAEAKTPQQSAPPPVVDPRNNFLGKLDSVMRGAADIATFGGADELAAAANAVTSHSNGQNFGERYGKNLQAERDIDKSDYENRFGYRLAGQIGAGVLTGTGLARMGLTFARNAPNLFRTAVGTAADSTVLGAAHGFGSGEDGVINRLTKAGQTAAMSAPLGFGAPYAVAGLTAAARPVVAPIMSRLRPDEYANRALAQTLQRSGQTADDIVNQLRSAQADSQGVFSVADALGHAGQRALSTTARNPHNARQDVIEFLLSRQAGQGRRVANALSEGFEAPVTAAQATERLTAARNRAADAAYSAARQEAAPVNINAALQEIDNVLSPGISGVASPRTNIADDSIEATLRSVRSRLATENDVLTDFNSILRIKQDIDDAIGKAVQSGANNKARLLGRVRDHLDTALEKSSQPYAAARNQYRTHSQIIEAIDTGRQAAQRGRVEDTIPAYQSMTPQQQETFRIGYAEPLIAQTQQAATGVNKARPLISDATAAEFPAFAAPNRGVQMQRRIAREQRMFETANAATGGSKTADNLADASDLAAFDPSIMQKLLSGRPIAAATDAVVRALSASRGQPAPVVERIARMLIETRPDVARQMLFDAQRGAARTRSNNALVNSILTNLGAAGTARLSP